MCGLNQISIFWPSSGILPFVFQLRSIFQGQNSLLLANGSLKTAFKIMSRLQLREQGQEPMTMGSWSGAHDQQGLSSRRSLEASNWVRTFERLFGLGRREFEEANLQKFKCSSGGGGGGGGGWPGGGGC